MNKATRLLLTTGLLLTFAARISAMEGVAGLIARGRKYRRKVVSKVVSNVHFEAESLTNSAFRETNIDPKTVPNLKKEISKQAIGHAWRNFFVPKGLMAIGGAGFAFSCFQASKRLMAKMPMKKLRLPWISFSALVAMFGYSLEKGIARDHLMEAQKRQLQKIIYSSKK